MKKNMRKGQQALEYLVTYGWAFVVVILTVGLFAYFGILNPERYIPDRCELGVQLSCADYVLEASTSGQGFVKVRVQNAFGVGITITDITTAAGEGEGCSSGSPQGECNSWTNVVVAPGNLSAPLILDLSGTQYTLAPGDKILLPIAIDFSRTESSSNPPRTHTIRGEVFATVQ